MNAPPELQAAGTAPGAAHPLGEHGPALLDLLSYIYLENDRPEKAAVLLAALDELGLADARQRVSLALAQLRSGKPETALATLDRVALQGGLSGAFHLVRAQTLVALGRAAEAEAAMRAYVNLRARQAAPADPR
ncbi:type III secretion apparatus assembly chaperone SctY [Castellaniella defragrans]|uniref:Putative Zn-dependent protease n=1 Tax=Castellaniella defragrans TaxID=75697 RepID=A0A7W9TQ84_CASDE|nr:tetratricopeptide repeat protein [Castellaniella defragrans]KAB0599866.1 tetratricopeptide repeat protein [Castellaniella defragrans]MBB6083537.1 putative Zn-dependent protease [Castellaniella defragrans]